MLFTSVPSVTKGFRLSLILFVIVPPHSPNVVTDKRRPIIIIGWLYSILFKQANTFHPLDSGFSRYTFKKVSFLAWLGIVLYRIFTEFTEFIFTWTTISYATCLSSNKSPDACSKFVTQLSDIKLLYLLSNSMSKDIKISQISVCFRCCKL